MSDLRIKIVSPRMSGALMVRVPAPVPGPCSSCAGPGRLRCSVCLAWYCTAYCQASHWPLHRRECTSPPPLLWPGTGVIYKGEEVLLLEGKEEQEMMSMEKVVNSAKMNISAHKVLPSIEEMKAVSPASECPAPSPATEMRQHGTQQEMKKHSTDYLGNSKGEVVESAPLEYGCKNEVLFAASNIAKSENGEHDSEMMTIKQVTGDKIADSNAAVSSTCSVSQGPSVTDTAHALLDKVLDSRKSVEVTMEINSVLPCSTTETKIDSKADPAAGVKSCAVLPKVPGLCPMVSVPRGSLSLGSKVMAVVCYLDSPSVFFICPTTTVDQFSNIFTLSQDPSPGYVPPHLGNCCLVQDREDDCWYRGEIVKSVTSDSVTLFLLDSGKMVTSSSTMLRPLPAELVPVHGLVSKVNLKGIKSSGDEWSKSEVDKAMHILDVGNDVTEFKVKVVKVDSKGEMFVVMKNKEGKDIASEMIEAGIALVKNDKKDVQDKKYEEFKPGTLPLGSQLVVLLKMVSPMEIYVCSHEKFALFENYIAMLEDAASRADPVTAAVIGDPVIACDEGVWYRAIVTQVKSDVVQVKLVDFGSLSVLPLSQLREPTPDMMKEEVLAVSCCLESWVGTDQDREDLKEVWESKMNDIVECFDELEVEIVEKVEEQLTMKAPKLEEIISLSITG